MVIFQEKLYGHQSSSGIVFISADKSDTYMRSDNKVVNMEDDSNFSGDSGIHLTAHFVGIIFVYSTLQYL